MQEGGVLNIRIKPEVPQHLFVGAMDGPPSCTPDDNLYDVWPKFLIMVLLQGQQHFVMDGEHFRIDAGAAESPEPTVFMLNVGRDCKLQFVNESTTPLRKVMISAPLPWIDRLIRSQPTSMPKLRAFFGRHLAESSFAPNRHLIQIAEHILKPPGTMAGELLTLYRNSHAFDIMCQACSVLVQADEGVFQVIQARLPVRDSRQGDPFETGPGCQRFSRSCDETRLNTNVQDAGWTSVFRYGPSPMWRSSQSTMSAVTCSQFVSLSISWRPPL